MWLRFLARRLGQALVALFVVVTVAFLVLRLSGGDPVRNALGPSAAPELVEQRRQALGLNDPLPVQYLRYLGGLLHGDLGSSLITGRSVGEIVSTRLPATLELALIALVVILGVSIPLGMWVAVRTRGDRRRTLGLAFAGVTGFFAAIPDYLFGVMLIVVFAVGLHALPVAGNASAAAYVLPVVALATASVCQLSRIARIETLRTLSDDYVRTARAKRIGPARLYTHHVLPNMVTAVLTLGGNMLGTIVTGSVLIEQVFNWPGVGTAFTGAITARDYGIVQGLALVYAALVLAVTLITDIVIALVDRRNTLLEAS